MNDHISHKAPRITLEPSVDKIIDAVSYIINAAKERGITLTQYDIVKTIFIADRTHLNKYGRPITFDNYVAMKDGPVPSLTYDLLKEHNTILRKYNIKTLPWERQENKKYNTYSLKRPYQDKDILSVSDKEALSAALTIIKSLTYGQIRTLTHNDPAYNEAWEEEGSANSYPISYGMLFDSPNFEAAETIQYLSKHR